MHASDTAGANSTGGWDPSPKPSAASARAPSLRAHRSDASCGSTKDQAAAKSAALASGGRASCRASHAARLTVGVDCLPCLQLGQPPSLCRQRAQGVGWEAVLSPLMPYYARGCVDVCGQAGETPRLKARRHEVRAPPRFPYRCGTFPKRVLSPRLKCESRTTGIADRLLPWEAGPRRMSRRHTASRVGALAAH
eukprot:364774-Chlamydomonas_euryale.AAC.24